MAAVSKSAGRSSSMSFLPPPRPKSPPRYPDLYGKRREAAKVQMLEREIGFLEEELKSVESLQPASKCCKEVTEFVVANSDPFIPTNKKKGRSYRFWKWLCGIRCLNLSWICCCYCSGCCSWLELPSCSRCCRCHWSKCISASDCTNCCDCNICRCRDCNVCSCCDCNVCSCCDCNCNVCDCCSYVSCPAPNWQCRCFCPCPESHCCRKVSCSRNCCCIFQFPSCPRPHCSCCTWTCSCPKCPKVRLCSDCPKTCCNPCCLFF